MKSFKNLVAEVAQPKPEEEKKFKDQHKVDIAPHPVSTEFQHKGIAKPKAKRKADQEGDANYDAAYTAESVEELDEISKKTLASYAKKASKDIGHIQSDIKDKEPGYKSLYKKKNNRIAGVARAVDRLAKEEVEELDEKKISKGMQAYIDIGNKKADATSKEVKGSIERVAAAMRAKRMKKEEVELDEKKISGGPPATSYKTYKDYVKANTAKGFQVIPEKLWNNLKNEEVELDEAKIGDKIKYRNIKTRRVRTGIVKKVDIVNGQKRYEVYGNRYVGKYVYDDELLESVDLHEADIYSIKNTKTGQIYHNSKYPIDKNTQVYKKIKSAGGDHKHAAIHKNGKLVQEEVEDLDELSKKTLGSYVKKASSAAASDAAKYGQQGSSEKGLGHFRKAYNRLDNIRKATDRLTKEEVEQLDELSPNTLNSYVKKSAGNMAAHTAIAAAQASSSMGKSTPDVKRKIANRMKGIAGASNRLADKANMAENWQEEIPMMIRQLEFIAYAAEEIMDYVEMAGDPEEWFQNKISGIHQSMLSMYAYAQGGRRAGYGFDEEVELDEAKTKNTKKSITRALQNVKAQPKEKVTLKKAPWEKTEELVGGQKKLDHNKNGKIDAHDFHLMRKKKMKEEVDQIDELSQDKLQSYHAKAALDLRKKREKLDKGTLTMKDLKKGQNRVAGLNRAANKMEGVESPTQMLDETFKQGVVKLKDGGSVVLKKEDADLLNQMFKDLSAGNRKKMQEVAMKDKAGFEEILGFAREAL
jgi:hypothetical protein